MTPDEITALVERLRDREKYVLMGPMYLMHICEEAATALADAEAQVAALKALVEQAAIRLVTASGFVGNGKIALDMQAFAAEIRRAALRPITGDKTP